MVQRYDIAYYTGVLLPQEIKYLGIVDIQINITLNCLDSPVVEHNLLAQNITCQAYRDMIKGDRPIYLAW